MRIGNAELRVFARPYHTAEWGVSTMAPDVMITSLEVRNFRSLVNTRVDFSPQPVTVFVGKTGVGKSNIIGALRMVRRVITTGALVMSDLEGYLSRVGKQPVASMISFRVTLQGQSSQGAFAITVGRRRGEGVIVVEEQGEVQNPRSRYAYTVRDGKLTTQGFALPSEAETTVSRARGRFCALPSIAMYTPHFSWMHEFLSQMKFYRFSPKEIRSVQPQQSWNWPVLFEDGCNLLDILRVLKENDPERYQTLLEHLSDYYNTPIQDIRITEKDSYLRAQVWYGDFGLNLEQESDGFLCLLAIQIALWQAIWMALHQGKCPLIAIEHPEQYVQIKNLFALGEHIVGASGSAQIVLTTHSPDLLNAFHPECVRIVSRDAFGTQVSPLSPEVVAAVLKKQLQLGEWLTQGF